MEMIHLLGATGLTFIITRSFIFDGFRERMTRWPKIGHLVNCPQCSGFWSGLLVFCLTCNIWQIILGGLATSGLCYIISSWLDREF